MGSAGSKTGEEIGSRNSGQLNALTASGRQTSAQVARQHIGPCFRASREKRVGRDKEPRIVFENQSSYRVSYWVVQEHKTRTTAHHKRIVSAMGVELKLGNGGGSAAGNASQETEETFDTEEDAYFLMRDHRIEADTEAQQTTEVQFPKDCQDLRVYGFFEEDGRWESFKDKVYSIGWFRKVFNLTALDSCILPYTKARNDNNAPDIPS